MKKGKKLFLAIASLFLGSVVLTGCTANFCEQCDKEHILYALEYGTTEYFDKGLINALYLDSETTPEQDGYYSVTYNDNIYVQYVIGEKTTPYIYSSNTSADNAGLRKPTENFWHALDYVLLEDCYKEAVTNNYSVIQGTSFEDLTADQIWHVNDEVKDGVQYYKGIMWKYGHIKFGGTKLLDNWSSYVEGMRKLATDNGGSFNFGGIELYQDEIPNSDYMTLYKSALTTAIEGSTYRACIASDSGYYGAYGFKEATVEIRGKAWTDWKGLLEFLLIWPISALMDVIIKGFASAGLTVASGVPQFLAIFIVTIAIRAIILLCTFKTTQSQTRMTALQPEITKIQNKYPNSKTNKYEQQKMASEMSALYKKNKVNPLSAFLALLIQFPVFICVWGAMQGSAYVSTGKFLGLNLSQSISSALFNGESWKTGAAWTALVLFLLMAVAQTFAMLIPQWMQKRRAKKVSKLGVNPSANSQNNKMKWFTIIMLVMIIFMGFSLASGLGVYWLVGAIFSIGQTLITQKITDRNQEKNRRNKVVN